MYFTFSAAVTKSNTIANKRKVELNKLPFGIVQTIFNRNSRHDDAYGSDSHEMDPNFLTYLGLGNPFVQALSRIRGFFM